MRRLRRTALYSLAIPLGGNQTIVAAAAAVAPTFPVSVSVPVVPGDLLRVTYIIVGNASAGATAPYVQPYVGGVAQSCLQVSTVPNGYDFTYSGSFVYTATSIATLAFDLYFWKVGNNWLLYGSGVNLQVARIGV